MSRLHAVVRGRVHAVGFRKFSLAQANTLVLRGWTRNVPGCTVEFIVEGTPVQLEEFLDAIRQGPALAEVHQLCFESVDVDGDLGQFRILEDGNRADARRLRATFPVSAINSLPSL